MTELNDHDPIEIEVSGPFAFKLKCDTTKFGAYTGQGVVEDVKVPKKVAFHSLEDSRQDPAAATPFGMLEPVNMSHFGLQRSEQIHAAIAGIHAFQQENSRYPADTAEDLAATVAAA